MSCWKSDDSLGWSENFQANCIMHHGCSSDTLTSKDNTRAILKQEVWVYINNIAKAIVSFSFYCFLQFQSLLLFMAIHPPGVLLPSLNSTLVNWLLSVSWLGQEVISMGRWGSLDRQLKAQGACCVSAVCWSACWCACTVRHKHLHGIKFTVASKAVVLKSVNFYYIYVAKIMCCFEFDWVKFNLIIIKFSCHKVTIYTCVCVRVSVCVRACVCVCVRRQGDLIFF